MDVNEKKKYIEKMLSEINKADITDEHKHKIIAYAQNLLDKDMPVIFDSRHIDQIFYFRKSYTNAPEKYYHTFNIGNDYKIREITAPSRKLKSVQKWILHNILESIPVSEHAYGFKKGCSILQNAERHMYNQFALCVDIKDFFGSIQKSEVLQIFRKIGYTSEASEVLSRICCYNGALPQGAPTSPYLANIVCEKLDNELAYLAKQNNSVYSRYADDITFSSDNDIWYLYENISDILIKYNFRLNNKTKYYRSDQPKFITGLVVQNGKVRVPKRYKRELRKEIYYCKKFGVNSHLDNSNAAKRIHYREYLYGKAYFVNMIERNTGQAFLKELDSIYWPDWTLSQNKDNF